MVSSDGDSAVRRLGECPRVRLDAVEQLPLGRVQCDRHGDGHTVIGDLAQDARRSGMRVLQVDAGVTRDPQGLVEVEGDDLIQRELEQVIAHRSGRDQPSRSQRRAH